MLKCFYLYRIRLHWKELNMCFILHWKCFIKATLRIPSDTKEYKLYVGFYCSEVNSSSCLLGKILVIIRPSDSWTNNHRSCWIPGTRCVWAKAGNIRDFYMKDSGSDGLSCSLQSHSSMIIPGEIGIKWKYVQ